MSEDPIPSFSAMLRQALGDALAPEATRFLDMFAEDGVMEFPYAPPGGVPRLEGRAALAAYLPKVAGMITFEHMTAAQVHRADGGVYVLEFEAVGRGVATGEPYEQRYVSVIKLADGHIVHYRDYWNPLVALRTLGGNRALEQALGGGSRE
jgi:ketosteroid isomerase-like protein